MNQFLLQQGRSEELELFPHIIELGMKKVQTIQLRSFPVKKLTGLHLYYVLDGKFEWSINGNICRLYPSDLAIVLPGQPFGGAKEFLDIGALAWITLDTDLGQWNGLSPTESKSIWKILSLAQMQVVSGFKEGGSLIQTVSKELQQQEIGFSTRINHLLDGLLILIARQLTKQNNSQRDFPQTFMKLEQELRGHLSHQWTVEEMAALVGLGTTAFTEKVKNYTGFSPLNYLINIRISEAIRLLKGTDTNLTDVALDTGFYSSQHFSTTFKKLTGYTPSQFRKNNSSNA
ncbi:MAG TPA: AraC family transcriptional regulator [Puia sp.]|nr:AraC family transcriptional regulator [Puia sp.]